MSILQQVIDEYGISEMPEAVTDKTAKRLLSALSVPHLGAPASNSVAVATKCQRR